MQKSECEVVIKSDKHFHMIHGQSAGTWWMFNDDAMLLLGIRGDPVYNRMLRKAANENGRSKAGRLL